MSQSQENDEQHKVLTASVHDLKHLAALFRGISFSNRATFNITDTGIVVTVEEARTLLATAWITKELFYEFIYEPEDALSQEQQNPQHEDPTGAAFEVPLNALIECMNIFGASSSSGTSHPSKVRRLAAGDEEDREAGSHDSGNARGSNKDRHDGLRIDQYFGAEKGTGMRMSYGGAGHPMTLLIAEESGGPTATCEISTFDPEPQLELPFDSEQIVLNIILKSSWLRDALSEIDPSCEKLTIIGNPPRPPSSIAGRLRDPPCLRLQAAGAFGSTEMDYPNDKEVLETCECAARVSFSYRFAHISRTLKALQSSTKTCLRITDEGLLSLQFMMPSPKPRGGVVNAFIEFRCLALDESC